MRLGQPYRFLMPAIAVIIVASSVFYSGMLKQSGAKDIDAKYFYLAARCWAYGKSPYEPATYDAVSRAEFGAPSSVPFVAYLPTLMILVLPLAPFKWPVAAKIFSLMNFSAAMILLWGCYRLVRESARPHYGLQNWFWITVASTLGAISGAILTGQTSVFIAAAITVALIGCRSQRAWLTVTGLVIASAKPHLSGPLLLFILLFEPKQRKAVAIAAAITVLIFGYAAWVDSSIVRSYLGSLAAYKSLPVNDPSLLIGIPSLLSRARISPLVAQLCGAGCLLAVMALAAALVKRQRVQSFSNNSLAVMLLVFAVGLARPIQGYDLCVYAPGIALLATMQGSFQAVTLVPALILWRPGPVTRLQSALSGDLISTAAWLVLLLATMVLACLVLAGKSQAAHTEAQLRDAD